MDKIPFHNLSVQDDVDACVPPARIVAIGEVLWDVVSDTIRLGGAPLNFSAHVARFGHQVQLVSAVGADAAGSAARSAIAALELDTTFLHTTDRFATGIARVRLEPGDETSFTIERPAAYDAIELTDEDLGQLAAWQPGWIYYGTLFPAAETSGRVLTRLLDRLSGATRFYDLNLRPGFDAIALVRDLLHAADVVKLNERELADVHGALGLPADPEGFCRAGAALFGWRAVGVTLGARGCAMLVDDDYAEAPGVPVVVVDTIGAGDAFAAAFVHGIVSGWPVQTIAASANRTGALVAAGRGAIPFETGVAAPPVIEPQSRGGAGGS